MVTLGELATITKGVSYTSAGLEDSGRVMVNLKNIGKGGGFRPEGDKHYTGDVKPDHLLQGGDLLIAYTDLTKAKEILGCPVIVPSSPEYVGACFSMDLGKIEPDPTRLDREYLAYWLQSHDAREYMKANGSGATVMHLRTAAVPALLIPVPPLEEQKRIVAKLDDFRGEVLNLQDVKNRSTAAIQDWSVKAKSQILSSVDANYRPLEKVVADNSPITYGVVQPGPVGDIPLIRSGDLKTGEIVGTSLRTITSEVHSAYSRTQLQGGEVLVALVGVPGAAAVVPSSLAGANIARQVALIRLNPSMSAEYIAGWMNSVAGREALRAVTQGSVQQVINLGDLRKLKVPVPRLEDQVKVCNQIEALTSVVRDRIENDSAEQYAISRFLASYTHAVLRGAV